MAVSNSIALKAYYHSNSARFIHYSVACLRQKKPVGAGGTFVDLDSNICGIDKTWWIFFYPAGANRRILELVLARYSLGFNCNNDVFFLCVNRPGTGGTSSVNPQSIVEPSENAGSPEQDHIDTTIQDIIAIMDYHEIRRASLFYMCAGSTFAYSFAAKFNHRTTGHILGVSSWILRSSVTQTQSEFCTNCSSSTTSLEDNSNNEGRKEIDFSKVHSLTHRMAMNGFFGPKWFVSWLAGGVIGNIRRLLEVAPPSFIAKNFKKKLSDDERKEFENHFSERNGEGFVELLLWMHDDGPYGEGSTFVNSTSSKVGKDSANKEDGNCNDIAVCLSTQEQLRFEYNISIPNQTQVLLWHGTNDRMISVKGSEYLSSSIPSSSLTKVDGGTHQGTMFFFPSSVMAALNAISGDEQKSEML